MCHGQYGSGSRLSGTAGLKSPYLPAAYSKEKSKYIGLFLLLQLFDVFESTHLATSLAVLNGESFIQK